MTRVEDAVVVMERSSRPTRRVLAVDHWHREADADERALLDDLSGPVLDIGCGPGRIVAALAAAGVPALGIDVAPSALTLARGTGAAVLHRSVFGRLPGEGRWATALLLDGNIGIGGDPERLLRRTRRVLRDGGSAVVEVEPPGVPLERDHVRLHHRDDGPGPWFPWAWVGVDDVAGLAVAAGFAACRVEDRAGRHFAVLQASVPGLRSVAGS